MKLLKKIKTAIITFVNKGIAIVRNSAFVNNVQAKFSMGKIMEVLMIVIMLPIITSLFTGLATTGDATTDAMLGMIVAIIPVILIFDVMSGLFGKGNGGIF